VLRRHPDVAVAAPSVERLRGFVVDADGEPEPVETPRASFFLGSLVERGGNAAPAVRHTYRHVLQLWRIRQREIRMAQWLLVFPGDQIEAVTLIEPRESQHRSDMINGCGRERLDPEAHTFTLSRTPRGFDNLIVKNWAGNVTYSTTRMLRPRSVEEAQEMVAGAETLRPLGTRHSFSLVADSAGALLSTEHLNDIVEIGEATVTVEAGIRYGELSSALHDHGLAVANLASLPHISVGGAIATGTHGSGVRNQSLAAAVSALELVCANGSIRRLRRGDREFNGAVVGLGALGLVARASLDVVPGFELRQYVFEELPWSAVETNLDEILAGGYSVSLFTTWTELGVDQVWLKTTAELGSQSSYFGATPARKPRNPVPGAPSQNCTEQLGVPGPSGERLPHFRLGFTPSGGAELQSEYVVAREHGADALRELRSLGQVVSPLLLISEIRTVAADTLWLSPFYEQDSIAFHFTWKPLAAEVRAVLPRIEAALAPFRVRPHWGKLFAASPHELEAVYPKLPAFRRLRAKLDSSGKFRNAFIARFVCGEEQLHAGT
jgi:xylitol oxidase